MPVTPAYGTHAADQPLQSLSIERREPGSRDVQIEILYCGVCHSDLHVARNEWGGTQYPAVPGHEIIGRVAAVGEHVTKFRPGDIVGVGCMVDSCRQCRSCEEGLEQFCENGFTATYNGRPREADDPAPHTLGGYARSIVVTQDFVLRIPDTENLERVAPLLCAGITTYSPLREWKIGKGHKVGVVGLGGLGHVAVRIAHAMGAQVVLFTTSPEKQADALRLGADEVVLSKNRDELKAHANSLDFILDTVAAPHDLDPYLSLLKRDATMALVGLPAEKHPSPNVGMLIGKRRRLAGSLIGGIDETQEMLDFCAEHGIVADVEVIAMRDINSAYERMLSGDVKYRFVIDMRTLEQDGREEK